jgi:microcystin-dependent protein
MKSYYIIIIIVGLLIYNHICIKQNQQNIKENMSNIITTEDTKIIKAINKVYYADIQAMRNLSDVATKLQSLGLILPCNVLVNGNIQISESFDLIGSTSLLPKGSIVAWNSNSPPSGWIICDGTNGTPNLKDRFVLGANSDKKINTTGGISSITLTANNIPEHTHSLSHTGAIKKRLLHANTVGKNNMYNGESGGSSHEVYCDVYSNSGTRLGTEVMSGTTAINLLKPDKTAVVGSKAYDFIPPYYVLTYIIKL